MPVRVTVVVELDGDIRDGHTWLDEMLEREIKDAKYAIERHQYHSGESLSDEYRKWWILRFLYDRSKVEVIDKYTSENEEDVRIFDASKL